MAFNFGGTSQKQPLLIESSRNLAASSWFAPLSPITPVAPPDYKFRQYGYQPGANLSWTPKGDDAIGFETLRELADAWDILRIAIEKKKTQIIGVNYELRLKQFPGEKSREYKARTEKDKHLRDLRKFFAFPDGFHTFNQWMKMWLEDMIVCDAVAMYMDRAPETGKISYIHPLDGASINRVLTEQGITPPAGYVGYQQVVYGLPAKNYDVNDIVYAMSNERTHKRYGYGYVERVLYTISFGLRRQTFQISEYTSGNMPEAFVFLPGDMNVQRVEEVQGWFDSILAGDLEGRRKVRFMPGYGSGDKAKPNIIFPKDKLLKDDLDVWLAQVVCACLGISSQPFMRMMNRSCYSWDTETLTENGWKTFDQIGSKDTIAQFVPETGEIEFVLPLASHVYDYTGEMISFKHSNIDILVTPEHKMWGASRSSKSGGVYKKTKAKDVKRLERFHFQASATYNGGKEERSFVYPEVKAKTLRSVSSPVIMEMDDWLEFLGYFLSEGGLSHSNNHYLLTLAQKKQPYADNIATCLKRTGLSYKEYPSTGKDGCRRWNVYGKALCVYLLENCGGYCQDKRIPREFFSLPNRQLRILFTALMDGDGSRSVAKNSTASSYATTSRQLADDVQEIAFRLGYSATISSHQPPNVKHQRQYTVLICARSEHSVYKRSITYEDYDGKVYCFEVPTGLFVTRRNGKIAIQGNSSEEANDAATHESLVGDVAFVVDVLNTTLNRMGMDGEYEFASQPHRDVDPLKAAQADNLLVGKVYTINRILEKRGEEPSDDPMADKLGMFTQNGFIPLAGPEPGQIPNGENPRQKLAESSDAPVRATAANKLRKSTESKTLQSAIEDFFVYTRKTLANRLRTYASANLQKADAAQRDRDEESLMLLLAALDWETLAESTTPILVGQTVSEVARALKGIDIDSAEVKSTANGQAAAWAADRAAEMVGMRRVAGALIENPDARYAISETTREEIRKLIAKALAEGLTMADLAQRIEEAAAFSPARAKMIAVTETQRAIWNARMSAWKSSGIVETVDWVLHPEHDYGLPCNCPELADGSPYPLDQAPEFPAHPYCMCELRVSKLMEVIQ